MKRFFISMLWVFLVSINIGYGGLSKFLIRSLQIQVCPKFEPSLGVPATKKAVNYDVNSSSAACDTSFVKLFGEPTVNDESFSLIQDGNGNYFIAGRQGSNSLILQIDQSGNILAQRSYNFTNGEDFIANLLVDEQGFLVGSARDQLNTNTTNVLFKINWQTGNLVWAKKVDNPAYNRFDRVIQHPTNGNYIFCGMTTDAIDNYIIEVDKSNGTVTSQFVSDYGANGDVYSGIFASNNAIYCAGQGRLGGGLDDIRPTLTKFDLNGNMQWARIHLRSPNQPSRLYNMDIFIENDTIVNCGRGSLTSDDLTTSQLLFYKTNLSGSLILAKSYTVSGGNTVAGYQSHPIPSGYIIQGTYNDGNSATRFFVAKLGKTGNVIWAKQLKIAADATGLTKPLTLIDGGFVVFAAQTTQFDSGQNNDLLFGKISLNGEPQPSCPIFEDINLVANNISTPFDGAQLPTVIPTNYNYANSTHIPLMANLTANEIPGCECVEVADSCNLQISFLTETACPLLFDGAVTVNASGGVPPYTYTWENDTVFTNKLTGLDVGTYLVTITDATGCQVVDSVALGAAMRPDVTSEVENASCFGVNDGTLTIVADDPSLQFSVQGSPISSQIYYDSIFAGSYQYFVIDTFGCIWEEVYFITAPNKIALQLPNSIEAPMCDSVELIASSTTSPLTWSWSPPDFLSCTDCPDPIASPFMTTTYHLMVMDSNGCKALDSIVVKVDFDGKAYMPNAFSPNGDGINDVFYVLGKCVEVVKIMRVFDRWGEMVFEKSNTPPNDPLYGWNGKFRGKDMNPDIYVYYAIVVLPDGTTTELQGDLTLLR